MNDLHELFTTDLCLLRSLFKLCSHSSSHTLTWVAWNGQRTKVAPRNIYTLRPENDEEFNIMVSSSSSLNAGLFYKRVHLSVESEVRGLDTYCIWSQHKHNSASSSRMVKEISFYPTKALSLETEYLWTISHALVILGELRFNLQASCVSEIRQISNARGFYCHGCVWRWRSRKSAFGKTINRKNLMADCPPDSTTWLLARFTGKTLLSGLPSWTSFSFPSSSFSPSSLFLNAFQQTFHYYRTNRQESRKKCCLWR